MSSSSLKHALRLAVLSAVLCGAAADAYADEATVLWSDGDVQLQGQDTEEMQPAAAGTAVPEGARVVTSESGSCGLGFSGSLAESAVTLKPSTSAQIKNLGESARIELEQGALFIKLSKLKKDSQFTVATPTAIASARGTGWLQTMDQIEVYEGSVSIKNVFEQEEALSQGEAYDLGSDGSFLSKRATGEENRSAWEKFGERAVSSPYFNRISAEDILNIRRIIDANRSAAACGAAGAYPWTTVVEPGKAIASAQINELRTALTEAPFVQSPDFVANYLDPVPPVQSGDPVRASTIRLLLEAAENTSC